MSEYNQLLLNLNHKQNFNYDDFYVSNSNYYAFKIIENWPKWEKNILNVYGEKYSGKSHLSNIFHKKYKAKKLTEDQINNFLSQKKGFELYKFNLNEKNIEYSKFIKKNCMITLPNTVKEFNVDGYFAAYLKKIK